jgi:hypothetical protein
MYNVMQCTFAWMYSSQWWRRWQGARHVECRHHCDECIYTKVHCMTLYMYSFLIPIRAFLTEGRTSWVRRYYKLLTTSYIVRRRYKISWRRTNGTRLPWLWRIPTSCTPNTQRAFMSPNKCFSSIGAETKEVSLAIILINLSRGGGYECDEYINTSYRH